jgi:hypothetical protein
MNKRFFLICFLFLIFCSTCAYATIPQDESISGVACYDWNNVLLRYYHAILALNFSIVLLLGIFGAPLFRNKWFATRPINRVIIFGIISDISFSVLISGWIQLFSRRILKIPGVSYDYLHCVSSNVRYVKNGILGLIGKDMPAITQLPWLLLLLLISTILSCCIAIIVSQLWNKVNIKKEVN